MEWIQLWLLLLCARISACVCVYGPDCLLPCRCKSDADCDQATGRCDNEQCKPDKLFAQKNNNPELVLDTYWAGVDCQTGNVAQGKPAMESTVYVRTKHGINATADKAVDGDVSTYACAREPRSRYAWWQVDLQHVHVISTVLIVTHTEGIKDVQLRNYNVYVGTESDVTAHEICGSMPSPLTQTKGGVDRVSWNAVQCTDDTVGRYVSVRKHMADDNNNWLILHEVAVIGRPVSNVQLGHCVRFSDKQVSPDPLLTLICKKCLDGWREPYCNEVETEESPEYEVVATTTEPGQIAGNLTTPVTEYPRYQVTASVTDSPANVTPVVTDSPGYDIIPTTTHAAKNIDNTTDNATALTTPFVVHMTGSKPQIVQYTTQDSMSITTNLPNVDNVHQTLWNNTELVTTYSFKSVTNNYSTSASETTPPPMTDDVTTTLAVTSPVDTPYTAAVIALIAVVCVITVLSVLLITALCIKLHLYKRQTLHITPAQPYLYSSETDSIRSLSASNCSGVDGIYQPISIDQMYLSMNPAGAVSPVTYENIGKDAPSTDRAENGYANISNRSSDSASMNIYEVIHGEQ